jgi:NTP pyrophosphatase (non-canonical NTP hydrolase)
MRYEVGDAFLSVWKQADHNHRTYSDTGSRENDIRFLALGLTGEAGELANFIKKRWRDGDGHDEAIQKEIADVCAYAFMLANVMGQSPSDLLAVMAEKQSVFVAKMRARATPPQKAPAHD